MKVYFYQLFNSVVFNLQQIDLVHPRLHNMVEQQQAQIEWWGWKNQSAADETNESHFAVNKQMQRDGPIGF